MNPGARRLALTAHVTASVGWLGAVGAFLALAIVGLTSRDPSIVRSSYLAMDVTGWYVIVPLSLASLWTGVLQSLGTEWGLFRHYWVLVKFLLTVVATVLLLVHMQPTGRVASAAAEAVLSSSDLRGLRVQLLADAVGALAVLLVATALSIYKPWGLTEHGRLKQSEKHPAATQRLAAQSAPWGKYILIGLVVLVAAVLMVHLFGGGMHQHSGS